MKFDILKNKFVKIKYGFHKLTSSKKIGLIIGRSRHYGRLLNFKNIV